MSDIDTDFMKEWPVVDMMDFEGVVIDATKWDSGEYTAMFNFYHKMSDREGEANSGMTLATHVGGLTLRELYLKLETLWSVGLFDGSTLSDHGRLVNENGDELAQISWLSFSDAEWDPENDDDMSGLTIVIESDFPPPTMLQ
jgi:hypothetical protein